MENCGSLGRHAIVPTPVHPIPTLASDPFVILDAPGGVEVHLLQTRRFKTVLLQWVVEAHLDERRAARAILPDLLTRATARYPDLASLSARCEELYGAELLASVTGHGPTQLLRLGFETVADRYAGTLDLFQQSVDLLAEVLHEPPLEGGRFRADHFEQERANLVRAIAGLADDKRLFAYRRMVEAMHAGTPYALHSWGSLEAAAALEEDEVRAAWNSMVQRAPVRMLLVGDVEPQAALEAAERLSGGQRRESPRGPVLPPGARPAVVRQVSDVQPLAQSKLVMGFRLPVERLADPAVPLCARVLGGDSHSRLFKRVREQESLAYGCSAVASLDSGTLVVQAGIDADAAERVQTMVLEECDRLAGEGLTEAELELSRRSRLRDLADLRDMPRSHCGFRLSALLDGRPHVAEAAEAATRLVTPAQIASVADACRLDTVFLLEGRQP
jgi:predicted Zn-dependent peptidase